MRLVAVTIKNFRGYENAVKIAIDDITAFVGRTMSENQVYLKHWIFSSMMERELKRLIKKM